jgi:peptidyl-prolyl cis-trans isomerase C
MFRTSLITALFALGLAACQQPVATTPGEFPGATGEAIATVNGKQVSSDMLDTVMRSLPEQVKAQIEMMGDTSPLVESIVASELLYQKAIESGIHTKPLVQQDIAMATRSALAEAMVRQIVTERLTDQRIQDWYNEHQVQFAQPQIKLGHIMFSEMAEAERVKAELDAGGDFAALATANSKDAATAANGGEIGWLDMRQMAPALRGDIETAEKGSVLGPMAMGRTIHIFNVIDKRDTKPLDEVREQIAAELEQTIRQEYVEELREAAVVVESYKTPAAAPAAPEAAPAEPAAPAAAEPQEGAAG